MAPSFLGFPLYYFGTALLLEVLKFFVGNVYCCKICSYLLGDLIVTQDSASEFKLSVLFKRNVDHINE